jgi:hypothetical protein
MAPLIGIERSRLLIGATVAFAALALVAHARSLDALCDDAFISLRYAENLARHGAPVYNLGERVEGYTSPLWMLLTASLLATGMAGATALKVLGGLSAVALVIAVWRLWQRIAPGRIEGLLVLALLAGSTPVAAWSSSGLETPLLAALLALAVAELCALLHQPTRARALLAGGVVALAVLTRPEAVLVLVAGILWIGTDKAARYKLISFTAAAAIPIAAWLCFRWGYYGELLPNTFVAKTAAPLLERLQWGLRYLGFTVSELGLAVSLLLGAALVMPQSRSSVRFIRALVAVYVVAVLFEGGDFLDLFRFFVPVLPLLYVILIVTSLEVAARAGVPRRGWLLGVALLAPLWVLAEISLRGRALRVDEPTRIALWIEPLVWTRSHALSWAEQGRFLRLHAKPGDTMASVAAGALPYHAGLPNLDLLGITDAETARRGAYTGSRPGHQRFATRDYVVSRPPTFLLLDGCKPPGSWLPWTNESYRCVEVNTTTSSGGTLRFAFLAMAARAEELQLLGVATIRKL